MLSRTALVCTLLFAVAVTTAVAKDYFVAPDGNDANPGTLEKPWKNHLKAAHKLMPGDTLYFRKGTYKGRNNRIVGMAPARNGEKDKPITFKNYENEHVVIDSAAADWGTTNNGYSYIVFDGFEITGGRRAYNMKISAHHGRGGRFTGHHVTVRNCEIHHSRNENVFCADTPHLVFENNHFHHSTRSHGLYLAAGCHDAVIRFNTSEHNRGNSGMQLNGASRDEGIQRATVVGNVLSGCAQGFSIINVRDSVFRNNVLLNNGVAGPRGSGWREVILWTYGKGKADRASRNLLFENNTFVNLVPKGVKMGNIMQVQANTRDVTFRNNIFVIRGKGLFTFRTPPKGFVFANNCLWLVGGGKQIAEGGTLEDLCKKHNLKCEGNIVKDPMFVDMNKGDLHLKDDSPCVDAGAKTESEQKPVADGRDIGAYEVGSDYQVGCKLPWKQPAAKTSKSEPAEGKLKDGTWHGASRGYEGQVEVEVVVKAGRIDSVKVVRQRESRPRSALRDVPKRIVTAQKPLVDKVTGATVTSRAVTRAAAAALAKARM
jgi:uncharacterized protein with FMN-binding domain